MPILIIHTNGQLMFSNNPSASLLQGLNPEQLSAVTWPPQSALVLAGAGMSRVRAFLIGAASGLVEPVFAVLCAWLVNLAELLLPLGLALAAGATRRRPIGLHHTLGKVLG